MKSSAFILILLVGFFNLQPVFSTRSMDTEVKSCKIMKCHKQSKPANKQKDTGCNPFMSCATGNFWYAEKITICFDILTFTMDKRIPEDDNRLASSFSKCWHPPKLC